MALLTNRHGTYSRSRRPVARASPGSQAALPVATRADGPPGYSDEWLRRYRAVCERSREPGLDVVTWSPLMISGGNTANRLALERSELRSERLRDGEPEPFGIDIADRAAVNALDGPYTDDGEFLAPIEDLLDGGLVVSTFEDDFVILPPCSPRFLDHF